jgi:hypothetical protein
VQEMSTETVEEIYNAALRLGPEFAKALILKYLKSYKKVNSDEFSESMKSAVNLTLRISDPKSLLPTDELFYPWMSEHLLQSDISPKEYLTLVPFESAGNGKINVYSGMLLIFISQNHSIGREIHEYILLACNGNREQFYTSVRPLLLYMIAFGNNVSHLMGFDGEEQMWSESFEKAFVEARELQFWGIDDEGINLGPISSNEIIQGRGIHETTPGMIIMTYAVNNLRMGNGLMINELRKGSDLHCTTCSFDMLLTENFKSLEWKKTVVSCPRPNGNHGFHAQCVWNAQYAVFYNTSHLLEIKQTIF